MIIWINGAFGGGKTTAAGLLHEKIEDSFIYDPENVGQFLWQNEPQCMKKNNFQDEPLWRKFNFEMIKNIYENFNGTIIIPMTIINKEYYEEIIGNLRGSGIEVKHFILGANRSTILKRLSSRSEIERLWAEKQIDLCIEAFEKYDFGGYIDTNDMPAESVAEYIKYSKGAVAKRFLNGKLHKIVL